MPRQKTVFNNSQVVHLFANRHQHEARNAGHTVWIDPAPARFETGEDGTLVGPVLYSYRTPIAAWHRMADGTNAVLRSEKVYSSTTAQHFPSMRDYPAGTRVFEVVFVGVSGGWSPDSRGHTGAAVHAANVAAFRKRYTDTLATLMRAPVESWRLRTYEADSIRNDSEAPTAAHAALRDIANDCAEYAQAFGVALPVLNWKADGDAAIARRDKILNDPKRAARLERERAQRSAREAAERATLGLSPDASNWQVKQARRSAQWAQEQRLREAAERKRAEQFPERLAAWRAGILATHQLDQPRDSALGDLLRIRGNIVETSRGAEVPLFAALAALDLWLQARRNCTAWEGSFGVGAFKLTAIGADGTARVGCHAFTAAELEAFSELATA